MKARRTNLSLRRPACLKTTPTSQKFRGILDKWEGKKTLSVSWILALAWQSSFGRCSFVADDVECCCIIFNPNVCFVLLVSPNSEKKCSRCKKMFSLQIPSASWTSTHIWWVAGRPTCLKNVDFWVGAGQRAERCPFIRGDLDRLAGTSPDFVTPGTGLCPDLSPDTVPAPFTVCSCNTTKIQKTSDAVTLIN